MLLIWGLMPPMGACLTLVPQKGVIFSPWLSPCLLPFPLFFFLKSYPTKIIRTRAPISGSASRTTLKITLLPQTGQSCSDFQLGQHLELFYPLSGYQHPISQMIFSILARDTALVPRRDLLFIPPDLPLFSLFSKLRKESLTWLNGCNSPHNWTQRVPTRKSRDLESSWDTGWAQPSSCVLITKLCWCLFEKAFPVVTMMVVSRSFPLPSSINHVVKIDLSRKLEKGNLVIIWQIVTKVPESQEITHFPSPSQIQDKEELGCHPFNKH